MSPVARLRARVAGIRGSGSIASRALGAGAWSVLGLGFGNVLRLGSNLVMTRLLAPEAFGLMAMVITLHVLLMQLTDIGIHVSVVRSERGEEPRWLRVAWTVQILRALVIAGGVVVCAGLLALLAPHLAAEGTVYADPDLPAMIAVSALIVVMQGLAPTTLFLAQRRMRLARLTAMDLGAQAVGIAAMIGFAWIEPSAWALLWGTLVGGLARLVAAHLAFPQPRMAPVWDKAIAHELWTFGRWMIGSSLAGYVAANADKLILAGLMPKQSFGFYVIAAMWIQVGADVVTRLTSDVALPALSEARRTGEAELARTLARARLVFEAICAAGFLFFFFLGAWLIALLYPPVYAVAGGYTALLSFRLLALRYQPFWAGLLAAGDSRSVMMTAVLNATALCLGLPAAYALLGIEGALLAVALSPLASAPLLLRRSAALGVDGLGRDWAMLAVIPALCALAWAAGG